MRREREDSLVGAADADWELTPDPWPQVGEDALARSVAVFAVRPAVADLWQPQPSGEARPAVWVGKHRRTV